ncbi:hypothetical protein VCHENC02_3387A, partial [Vibrio harveyi]
MQCLEQVGSCCDDFILNCFRDKSLYSFLSLASLTSSTKPALSIR